MLTDVLFWRARSEHSEQIIFLHQNTKRWRSLCARLQQNGCDCGVRTFGTLEDFSGGDGDERDWAICSIDQMREDMLMKMWEEGM